MMRIKLIRSIEHWREAGQVAGIIDYAERQSGYMADTYAEYDDDIAMLKERVVRWLERAGHTVDWTGQQSVGVGAIVQGPFAGEAERIAMNDLLRTAIDHNREAFLGMCVDTGRSNLEAYKEEL
jgi:hypothetical protein